MKAHNIGTSVHFIPNHIQPYYRDKYRYAASDFPVAMDAYNRLVSLPLHPGMTEQDTEDVVQAVKAVVATHSEVR